MNSYELSRAWFEFSMKKLENVKPIHTAVYFFAIDKCNRLGWPEKFGLPRDETIHVIGLKSPKLFKPVLEDLRDWGFIEIVEESKNQFTANVIALVKNAEAQSQAQSQAWERHEHGHSLKQGTGIVTGSGTIIKPLKTNKPLKTLKQENKKKHTTPLFNFQKSLLDEDFDKQLVLDWMIVRREKKASNTKTAFESFLNEVKKSGKEKNEILKRCVEKSWKGFKASWEWEEEKKEGTREFLIN